MKCITRRPDFVMTSQFLEMPSQLPLRDSAGISPDFAEYYIAPTIAEAIRDYHSLKSEQLSTTKSLEN